MSEPLVRGADLLNPECAECDHVEGFHGYLGCRMGVFDADAVSCDCKRTDRDVRLAHIETIVRREVEKALAEVRDALNSHDMRYEYRNAERDAVASIRASLERRFGADWLDGPDAPDAEPKCTSVWETCEVHGSGGQR